MKHNETSHAEWLRATMAHHAGPLTRYAATITADLDRARDIVQDTFVRLCAEERSRVEPCLTEWLFTVCRHRALDVVRKENRMTRLDESELDTRASSTPSPAHETERQDTHRHVLRALATLPKNQQEVVRLKFQNGLSYEEISRITQLTVTNVGFLIHTAVKTLRHRLQADTDLFSNAVRRMP